MSTFKDFLVWYNNLDVVPFLEAVEKMSQFWQERTIDMFKDGISVPGLTLKYLFSYLSPQTYFSLFDQAISFTSLKTTTPEAPQSSSTDIMKQAKQRSERLKKARLLSCARRSWVTLRMICTSGLLCRTCQREVTRDAFKPESSIKMAIEWLEWVAHKERIHIRHQLNNTEKRIGDRKLPVDGFHAQTQIVYQFHGCYWHGNDCALTRGKEIHEKRNKPTVELLEETRAHTEYIKSKGYRVLEMWECEWPRMKRTNRELQRFIAIEVRRTLDKVKIMSAERILSEVQIVWVRGSGYSRTRAFEREIQPDVPDL